MENKTRAELAMEDLKAKMPKDSMTNLGINEAYRQGLEDMVDWLGRGDNELTVGGIKK